MPTAHEHDGAHEAVEHFLKEGLMVATQYAKHHQTQKLANQHEATRRAHELLIWDRQAHLQRSVAEQVARVSESASPSNREPQISDNAEVAEGISSLRDFQLSHALVSGASPHSIEQVAEASDAITDPPEARRAAARQELSGERETRDR